MAKTPYIRQTVTGGLGGATLSGSVGVITPAELYKIDRLWESASLFGSDVSYTGDVEGSTIIDSSGTKIAYLTIPDYESLKENLQSTLTKQAELISQIEALSSQVSNLSDQMSELGNDDLQSELNGVRESINDLQAQVSSANAIAQSAAQDISDMSTEFSELKTETRSTAQDISNMQTDLLEIREDALDLSSELENLRDQQKEYLRTGGFSTVDGSLVFYDGYGVDVLTVGGGWYEEETIPSAGD